MTRRLTSRAGLVAGLLYATLGGSSVVAQVAGAEALLEGVAGTPPVACELVVRSLGNRWGSSSLVPRVHPPLGATDPERDVATWAWTGRPAADDAAALLDGLEADDACVRRVAARLVGLVDDPETISRLITLATTGSGSARLAAITALAQASSQAGSQALSGLLADRDIEVRRAAAWALAATGDDHAVPGLAGALRDSDLPLRENAAWALGRIERPSAVRPLTEALRDPRPGVRVNAAWALGSIEDPGAIPALAALLGADADDQVRHAAAWALGRIEH